MHFGSIIIHTNHQGCTLLSRTCQVIARNCLVFYVAAASCSHKDFKRVKVVKSISVVGYSNKMDFFPDFTSHCRVVPTVFTRLKVPFFTVTDQGWPEDEPLLNYHSFFCLMYEHSLSSTQKFTSQ